MKVMEFRSWGAIGAAAILLTACGANTQADAEAARSGAESAGEGPSTVASCEPEILHEEFAALPAWLAVNDESVFWVEQRAGALFRRGKHSKDRAMFSREVGGGWAALVADSEAVYVDGRDGMVHRIAVDGSFDHELSEIGGERASHFHLQGGYLYWLWSSGDPYLGRASMGVRRVSADGSASSEELWEANRTSYGLVVQGDHLFVDEYSWPSPRVEPAPNGAIIRVATSGAPSVVLAADLLFPVVHAADDRFVYYSAQTPDSERLNQLWRVSSDGGVPELLFDGAPRGVNVGQMVVESGTTWWGQGDYGGGVVRRLSSGHAMVVAELADVQHMQGFAVDADALYFSSSFSYDDVGAGRIWRVGRHCPTD
jgi:hypothetical protein